MNINNLLPKKMKSKNYIIKNEKRNKIKHYKIITKNYGTPLHKSNIIYGVTLHKFNNTFNENQLLINKKFSKYVKQLFI